MSKVRARDRLIESEDGREVYFPHNAVTCHCGFDWLRKGQLAEYTLEDGRTMPIE